MCCLPPAFNHQSTDYRISRRISISIDRFPPQLAVVISIDRFPPQLAVVTSIDRFLPQLAVAISIDRFPPQLVDYCPSWVLISIDVVVPDDGLSPAERIVMQKYIIPCQQPNSWRIIFPFLLSSRTIIVFRMVISHIYLSRCPAKGSHSQRADNEFVVACTLQTTIALCPQAPGGT